MINMDKLSYNNIVVIGKPATLTGQQVAKAHGSGEISVLLNVCYFGDIVSMFWFGLFLCLSVWDSFKFS